MTSAVSTTLLLQNAQASLTVDLFGGAITDFHLMQDTVNPLSFRFSPEQMPVNNKAGAPYQGHFLCLGRWGEPSQGERKAGMPNHGQMANIMWQKGDAKGEYEIKMTATSPLEGLQVNRTMLLDEASPVIAVEEIVQNINPLGRLYNMVQHPTLGQPFLDNAMVVDCNGAMGFNQALSEAPEQHALPWPFGYCEDGSTINLLTPEIDQNSVFSFTVEKTSRIGWITAFSPKHQTLIGYVWLRQDYPWIHLWQDWSGGQIRYRGIEFGTAGIHKPFKELLFSPPLVFGESTYAYIDAGDSVSRRYLCFLAKIKSDFARVASVEVARGKLKLQGKQEEQDILIETNLADFI